MKRAQASLEFLMTYGWAFLVIMITIGALYSFGIFDFSKYLPQKCVFPSQFDCLDFSLKSNPNDVNLKLANNLGEDICIKSIIITNDASPPISCISPSDAQGACAASEIEWLAGFEKDLFFTSCTSGAYVSGTRQELKVAMTYYAINTQTKPLHTINGKINGRVT